MKYSYVPCSDWGLWRCPRLVADLTAAYASVRRNTKENGDCNGQTRWMLVTWMKPSARSAENQTVWPRSFPLIHDTRTGGAFLADWNASALSCTGSPGPVSGNRSSYSSAGREELERSNLLCSSTDLFLTPWKERVICAKEALDW